MRLYEKAQKEAKSRLEAAKEALKVAQKEADDAERISREVADIVRRCDWLCDATAGGPMPEDYAKEYRQNVKRLTELGYNESTSK